MYDCVRTVYAEEEERKKEEIQGEWSGLVN